MEEQKLSRVHFDLAKKIIDTIADGEDHISQQAVFQVLKPLLEDNITAKIQREHKIPDRWFTNNETDKNNLINELSSYL